MVYMASLVMPQQPASMQACFSSLPPLFLLPIVLDLGLSSRMTRSALTHKRITAIRMTDFTRARINMVEGQLRAGHVRDGAVLRQFAAIPKERFLPPEQHGLAYAALALPLAQPDAEPRFLMEPVCLARLIEALSPKRNDLLLDIGCASGYACAMLAALAEDGAVIGLEESRDLAAAARRNCATLGLNNITILSSPLLEGTTEFGLFDGILVEGALLAPPLTLLGQLKQGGRLAAIIDPPAQVSRAFLFVRNGEQVSAHALFDAQTPCLPASGQDAPKTFSFAPEGKEEVMHLPERSHFALPLSSSQLP